MKSRQTVFLIGIALGYLIMLLGVFITGSFEANVIRFVLNCTLIFGGLMITRQADKENQ